MYIIFYRFGQSYEDKELANKFLVLSIWLKFIWDVGEIYLWINADLLLKQNNLLSWSIWWTAFEFRI